MVVQDTAQTAIAAEECVAADESLVRAFDLLGKRWTGVLLGTLRGGPVGFRALARAVPGISDSVLSDRLGELAEAGLVDRKVTEGPPVSVTYSLTEAGRALLPALEQIRLWAERHLTTRGAGSSARPEPALRKARRR
jgi:DNA-binding HxlR family transcriptional regulator